MAAWTAEWLEAHGATDVRVQDLGERGANVLIGPPSGPELAFYGHLDTSLSGEGATDGPLTGIEGASPAPWQADGVLWGPGMAVAKAPTAAALVTLLGLQARYPGRVGALIAAGGTHRAVPPPGARTAGSSPRGEGDVIDGVPTMAVGARAALAGGFRPGAVLSVKGGAPGPLYEEPGSLYLAVTVTGEFGAAAFAGGGSRRSWWVLPAALGPLIAALGRWRRQYLAQGSTQDRSAGAGRWRWGLSTEGLPGEARPVAHRRLGAYLYVVTLPAGRDDHGGGIRGAEPRRTWLASLAAHLAGEGHRGQRGGVRGAARRGDRFPTIRWPWRSRRGVGGSGGTGLGARVAGAPPTAASCEPRASPRCGPALPTSGTPRIPRIEGARLADLERVAQVWSRAGG